MPSTPYEVVTDYLTSIGVSSSVLPLSLHPAKYEAPVGYYAIKKTNVLACNRRVSSLGHSTNQSHIHIHQPCWFMFFDQSDITDYENTGDTHESFQSFRFFEANLCHMLSRRSAAVPTDPQLSSENPKGSYSINDNIIHCTATKWIDSNSGSTQLRLNKINYDSDLFWDFRLGIQINDYWFLFKDRYSEEILAVSVPQEFVRLYDIYQPPKAYIKTSKADEKTANLEDAEYTIEAGESDPITVPLGPTPRPMPIPTPSGLKYKATPAIGKTAIRLAHYACELTSLLPSSHDSFIARSTTHPYMEPHHLIPISRQGLFDYDIDKPSNIVCLCPVCHKRIHYGEKDDIKSMLKFLLAARILRLQADGIKVSEEDLYSFYDL